MKVFKAYDSKGVVGTIYNSDALLFLKSIDSYSADIVFLDPPFNLGKKYGKGKKTTDHMSENDYSDWMMKILKESVRILKEGGALYLYHLPLWAMRFGIHLESTLMFKHWIAISMKNGFVRTNKLYPAHYALLFFTKGKPNHINRPKLRPQVCKKCGEFIKDYGGYKKIIEEKGINLSDFWEDLSPVRHKNVKLRVQNQLPVMMTDRIVAISGKKNELFIDPFAGTGTGIISAIKTRMNFLCNDIVEENCKLITDRILENFKI
jgi:site-specific DNA-methyltransferase (adenine-specific)